VVLSGHPSVENGQSADENQVSSTSSSCRIDVSEHVGHDAGSSRETIVCPFAQYHAGMRWPHQSWREIHHGWMFSIQSV
jgi:hypothetical protein